MRRLLVLSLVAGLIGLGGCTRSKGYDAVREIGEAKARCERELTVQAQRSCEAEYEKSYEEYRAQRRDVLKEEAEH